MSAMTFKGTEDEPTLVVDIEPTGGIIVTLDGAVEMDGRPMGVELHAILSREQVMQLREWLAHQYPAS